MRWIVPLFGLTTAAFFAFMAAKNLPNPLSGEPEAPPQASPATPPGPSPHAAQHKYEPAYKAVVHCLSDMDDLLDTVHDHASFAAIKPKLLSRAREHVALAADYPNQGMTQLSRAAAREWQTAANRHTESLARAIQVAPEVRVFFEHDIAKIMSPQ